jgi:predicted nucleic acid-binding protein
MIADTTFLSDLIKEQGRPQRGPASRLLYAQRSNIRITVISLAEVAVWFPATQDAWETFKIWSIYNLHRGIVNAAADVDREMIKSGFRLGENDNWIAGFARYYREPVISRDTAFDRVPGLRRIGY